MNQLPRCPRELQGEVFAHQYLLSDFDMKTWRFNFWRFWLLSPSDSVINSSIRLDMMFCGGISTFWAPPVTPTWPCSSVCCVQSSFASTSWWTCYPLGETSLWTRQQRYILKILRTSKPSSSSPLSWCCPFRNISVLLTDAESERTTRYFLSFWGTSD